MDETLPVSITLNELRYAIHQSIVLDHIPKSNKLSAYKVLTNKIHRHCDVAERLLWEASYSEALMILRSAFEAALTMNYLVLNPEEVIDYEYYSLLVSYKDMSLWVKYGLLDPDFESSEGKPLQQTLAETKQRLLDFHVHEKYKILPDKLDDIEYLSKRIKGNFLDVYTMIRALKEADPPVFVDLSERNFFIYNEGSKHVHPNYFSACDFFTKPAGEIIPNGFSVSMALRHIQYIYLLNVWGLNKIKGIQDFAKLKPYFDDVISSIQALD